jgi:hypothetical protein
LKKIATIPRQWCQKPCWYFLTNVEESASVRNYRCSLHLEVFRGLYFPQGTEILLLANSPKDNPRVELVEGREGFLWLLGLRIAKLHLYLLTLGTGDHLVSQAMLAFSSTPYPNVGDYKGQTGLSSPATYPSTVEYGQTKVAANLDTTSKLLATTLALGGVIRLYQGPLLEHPPWGRTTNLQTSISKT